MLTVVSLNKEWGIKDKHINKSNWKFWIFLILEIFSFIVSFISHDPASGFFVVVRIFHLNELTKRFFSATYLCIDLLAQVKSLPRQMKYVKVVTTAAAHHQDECTPGYLRTQEQSEQTRAETHLAPFTVIGPCQQPGAAELLVSLFLADLLYYPTQGWADSSQPACLPLNQTSGTSSCSIPPISLPVPHHTSAKEERARNPSKLPCAESRFHCTLWKVEALCGAVSMAMYSPQGPPEGSSGARVLNMTQISCRIHQKPFLRSGCALSSIILMASPRI